MLNIKSLLVGLFIAVFAKDIASNALHNYAVEKFLGNDGLKLSILLPTNSQVWKVVDVKETLSAAVDMKGESSCVHMKPIAPEYQITSILEDGTKICCNISKSKPSMLVPYRELPNGSTDFLCGYYPDHQVVRVDKI